MPRKKKKKVRWGRVLILILILILILAAIIGGGLFGYYKYSTATAKNMNIVLIGVDGRESTENTSRADSIMLINVNKDEALVNMISLPRDSYVELACNKKFDKITHAYSYGDLLWQDKGAGRACTIDTVKSTFGLNELEKYAEVDFSKMISLVDDIGGIELIPSKSFCEMDENENADSYCFEEGVTTKMNGKQALAYARHRYSDSDIYRAARQQEVIKAMFSKVKSLGFFDMIKIANKLLATVDTNVTLKEIIGYMDIIDKVKIEQSVAEGEDEYIYSEAEGIDLYYYRIDEAWLTKMNREIKK
ncbi:MAG: LCP family protein [Erysipelotrichaceae bacterium]